MNKRQKILAQSITMALISAGGAFVSLPCTAWAAEATLTGTDVPDGFNQTAEPAKAIYLTASGNKLTIAGYSSDTYGVIGG